MATLQYVGRNPDSDSIISPKSYADSANTAVAVTTTVVNTKIASAAATLTSQSYVDTEDAMLAQKTVVIAADTAYIAATQLGVASGVASLDSSGNLTSAQVPSGVVTERGSSSIVGTVIGTFTTPQTVTTNGVREFKLATASISDPGFPWYPLPFAWVSGNSAAGPAAASRQVGNANYGQLTVMPPIGAGNTIYGLGICTASPYYDFYSVIPYGGAGATPTTNPAITGPLTLDLYGCCYGSGGHYTFSPTNLTYFVLCVPAL